MTQLNCLDLFAGAGGLSLGLIEAGVNVTWANEFDQYAAESYKLNHKQVNLVNEDIAHFLRRVKTEQAELRPGAVDLICGGPPCQGFSGYNRHRHPSDPRNSLVEEFLDFIVHLAPRYVLMENVPGMLSLDGGRTVDLIRETFVQIGYESRLGIMQSGYYGVPQNRWRVFIWAAERGSPLPNFPSPTHTFPKTTLFGAREFRSDVVRPLVESDDLFYDLSPTVTVGDAISDLPPLTNGGGLDVMPYDQPAITDYQLEARDDSGMLFDHRCKRLGDTMLARCRAVPKREGAGWLDLPDELKPKNLLRHGDNRYDNRFGRLHDSGIFNTIVHKPEPYWGRVFHPHQDRVISVRESARAQSFPDTFKFCGPFGARYSQVGNAVPPRLAKALGMELVAVAKAGVSNSGS